MRVRYQAAPHPELNLSTRVWDSMTIHVHPNVLYPSRGGRITPLGRETASLNSNLRPSRFYRDVMTSHVHPNVIYLSRGGRIRTCDLLLPKQAR